VTDDDGLTDSVSVSVTVENKVPVAVIVADPASGHLPLVVNFDGSGSYDPDDPNGTVTTYSWDFGDGGSSTDTNPSHTYTVVGSYTATLTVTDDRGDSGSETASIVVAEGVNQAPNVDAGPDQVITLSSSAVLDGTVTDDGLPNPPGVVTTAWSEVSGPGTVTFADTSAVDTTADFSETGTYVLQLTADDSELNTSSTVTITVEDSVIKTLTLTSIGAEDGWVRESSENSNVGRKSVSTGSGSRPIRLGDDKKDRQIKAILSFDTSVIPGDATVLSATLRLRRGRVIGINPFETHGVCQVDVATGGFNGNVSLQKRDFEVVATVSQAATLSNATSNGSWSIADLGMPGIKALNTTGKTQFRVYFQLDDNDDRGNDNIGYY
ncbi:MAG: PKD domain-containing protein, partial [Aestuariibacter sp.]|nr:PKD domain-containing protein [Aestuariibacter sp.]